jgi:hypothetical protein
MSETHSLAPGLTVEDVQFVAPGLVRCTQEAVTDGVWKRAQLNPSDRGLITVAALVCRLKRMTPPEVARAIEE